jgi:hypothetical protein
MFKRRLNDVIPIEERLFKAEKMQITVKKFRSGKVQVNVGKGDNGE